MFKMGCSMAKRILTSDKGNNNNSSSSSPGQPHDGSSSKKSSKDKHQLAAPEGGSGGGGSKPRASGDELNDFSKLEEDPRIPLNVRQIFKITKSWKAIARTMSKTGTAMFLNLFEQNQDLFYLFARFQHLKGIELHESMELREHAATVMSTLDHSINSLSDYDNFVTYLHSIGKLHRKVPGFKRDHFWKIEQPFLKAVKQTLDERCNETIEEIYKIAIKLIIETIADGYGEDQPDNGGIGTGEAQRPSGGSGNGSGNGGAGNENSGPGGDNGGQHKHQQQNGASDTTTTNNNISSGAAAIGRGSNMGPQANDNSGGRSRDSASWSGCPMDGGMHCPDKRAPPIAGAKTGELGQFEAAETGRGSGASVEPESGDKEQAAPVEQGGSTEGTLFALTDLLALMVAGRPTQKEFPEARNVGGHLQASSAPTPTTTTARTITTNINTEMEAKQTDGCAARRRPCQVVGFGDVGGSGADGDCGCGSSASGSLINHDGHQFGPTNVQQQQQQQIHHEQDAASANYDGMMSHGDAELNSRNGGEKCCLAANGTPLPSHQNPDTDPEGAYQTPGLESIRKRPTSCCPRLPTKPNDKAYPATRGHQESAYISYGSSGSNINNNDNNNDSCSATNSRGSIYDGPVSTNPSCGPNMIGGGSNGPMGRRRQLAAQHRDHGRADDLNPIEQRPYPLDATTTAKPEIGHHYHHQQQQPNGLICNAAAPPHTTTTTARYTLPLDDDHRGKTQFSAHTIITDDKGNIQTTDDDKLETQSNNLANLSSCPGDRESKRAAATSVWRQLKQSPISSLVNRKFSNKKKKKKRKEFLLTSDPGDLCEFIKMLMLTVASRKACLDYSSNDATQNRLLTQQ